MKNEVRNAYLDIIGSKFGQICTLKKGLLQKNTTKIGRITHCDTSKKVSPTTGRQKMDEHPSSPGPWIIVFHDNDDG